MEIVDRIKNLFQRAGKGRKEADIWNKIPFIPANSKTRSLVLVVIFYAFAFLYFVGEARTSASLSYSFYILAIMMVVTEPYVWIVLMDKPYDKNLKSVNVIVGINLAVLTTFIFNFHDVAYAVPVLLLMLMSFDFANGNPYPFRTLLLMPVFIFLHHEIFTGLMIAVAIFFITSIHLERQVVSSFIIRKNVNDLSEEYEKIISNLHIVANYDNLTGLLNHRGMEGIVAPLFEYQLKNNLPFAFIMLDIDYFKKVNDDNGHDVGDAVLKDLARLLEINTRPEQDFITRVGGEEFLLVSTAINNEEELKEVMDRIKKRIRNHRWTQQLKITVSLGGTLSILGMEDKINTFQEGVKRADVALYRAKQTGRDRFVIFTKNELL